MVQRQGWRDAGNTSAPHNHEPINFSNPNPSFLCNLGAALWLLSHKASSQNAGKGVSPADGASTAKSQQTRLEQSAEDTQSQGNNRFFLKVMRNRGPPKAHRRTLTKTPPVSAPLPSPPPSPTFCGQEDAGYTPPPPCLCPRQNPQNLLGQLTALL